MQGHDVDRVKLDDRCYRVECACCGKYFEATRSDASFCSSSCRVSFSREDDRRRKMIQSINNWGRSLERTAQKYRRNKEVFEAMLQLQRDVQFALSLFEE